MKHVVCTKHELKPGEIKEFKINGRRILLGCKEEDIFSAVSASCPHQGADLVDVGTLEGTTSSDNVGDVKYVRCNEILRCPRHGYEFEIDTGKALFTNKNIKLKSYKITIEGDNVVVEF